MERVNVQYIYHIEQRDAAKGFSLISIHSILGIELLLLPLFKEDYFVERVCLQQNIKLTEITVASKFESISIYSA